MIDLKTWTAREKEWYFSEKRLLFATTKHNILESWINVLKILMKGANINE